MQIQRLPFPPPFHICSFAPHVLFLALSYRAGLQPARGRPPLGLRIACERSAARGFPRAWCTHLSAAQPPALNTDHGDHKGRFNPAQGFTDVGIPVGGVGDVIRRTEQFPE